MLEKEEWISNENNADYLNNLKSPECTPRTPDERKEIASIQKTQMMEMFTRIAYKKKRDSLH